MRVRYLHLLLVCGLVLFAGCRDDDGGGGGGGSDDSDFLDGGADTDPVDLGISKHQTAFLGGSNEGLVPTDSSSIGMPIYTLDPNTPYTLRFILTNDFDESQTAKVRVRRIEHDAEAESDDGLVSPGGPVTTTVYDKLVDILPDPGGANVFVGHAQQGDAGAPDYGPGDTGTVSYRIDVDYTLRVPETNENNNSQTIDTQLMPVLSTQ